VTSATLHVTSLLLFLNKFGKTLLENIGEYLAKQDEHPFGNVWVVAKADVRLDFRYAL